LEKQTLLDERYELFEEVGGGGMATVYRAFDRRKKRFVAIKLMRPSMSEQAEYVRMFEQEARVMKRLKHANIVEYYNSDLAENNQHYIVMEYIQGETLKQLLARRGKLDAHEALEIVILVTRALQYAHARGVVHCDVKPHNILLANDGTLKIVDFGVSLAGLFGLLVDDNTRLGSVYYLAPEQAVGLSATPQADIYSLGIVFYELLTGRVPFSDTTSEATLARRLEHEVEFSKEEEPSRGIADIVRKMTIRDLGLRYHSTSDLLDDLLQARQKPEGDFVEMGRSHPLDEGLSEEIILPNVRSYNIGKIAVVAIVSMLVLAFGVIGARKLFFSSRTSAVEVTLPNFVGLTTDEANLLALREGLNLLTHTGTHDDVEAGVIYEQHPFYAGGRTINSDTAIEIWVSLGPELIDVPNLVGKYPEYAKRLLEDAGFVLGEVEPMAPSRDQAPGTIISQDLARGYKGDTVNIWVCQP